LTISLPTSFWPAVAGAFSNFIFTAFFFFVFVVGCQLFSRKSQVGFCRQSGSQSAGRQINTWLQHKKKARAN